MNSARDALIIIYPQVAGIDKLSTSCRTNILENATRKMLLKVTLMVGLYLDN